MLCQLNADQKTIYDVVSTSVNDNVGGFFFIYESGGIGKTFLWKKLITTMHSEGKIVFVVASSGIASLLLLDGRTTHSSLKYQLMSEKI